MASISRFSFHEFYARFWPLAVQVPVDTSYTMATARVYLMPIQVLFPSTVDRICVIYSGTRAGNMRVGIYTDAGDSPFDGDLVVESASIAKSGTWRHQEFTIAATFLEPGLYWVAIQSDEATTVLLWLDGVGTVPVAHQPYYYDRGGGYGAMTDPCPAVTAINYGPICYLRVSSVD